MESILTSIKKLLGIEEEYEHFDPDIIMHINSVFMILNQIGVGPSEGFTIEDDTSAWTDFMPDTTKVEAIKSYIHLKVKLLFDPPTSPAVIESMNRMISEFEWRFSVATDYRVSTETGGSTSSTRDYNELINKPSINGQELVGNYNEQDPNVKKITTFDIDAMFKDKFND